MTSIKKWVKCLFRKLKENLYITQNGLNGSTVRTGGLFYYLLVFYCHVDKVILEFNDFTNG